MPQGPRYGFRFQHRSRLLLVALVLAQSVRQGPTRPFAMETPTTSSCLGAFISVSTASRDHNARSRLGPAVPPATSGGHLGFQARVMRAKGQLPASRVRFLGIRKMDRFWDSPSRCAKKRSARVSETCQDPNGFGSDVLFVGCGDSVSECLGGERVPFTSPAPSGSSVRRLRTAGHRPDIRQQNSL